MRGELCRKKSWTFIQLLLKKLLFTPIQIRYRLKSIPIQKQYDFIIVLNGKDLARTQIRYQPSRLDILKGAGKYNLTDNRFIPEFTYQSADNPDLQRIRNDLKLDSIAGKGSQLSQIFNLMHWVHNLVKHDGNSNNPTLKNAIDLVNVCKIEAGSELQNVGYNFKRMLDLAKGIKSRYITCMPKETEFDDCQCYQYGLQKEV